ncbi:MAG: tetratricopeptide repeat protein, partial [Pseudomonadota bacterium]
MEQPLTHLQPDNPKHSKSFAARYGAALVALALTAAIAFAYAQVRDFDFVNYDDPKYVYENKQVLKGLTVESVTWACTAFHEATWQPMVWLSYMLGQELHGMDPGWYHLTNVFLHMANTLLLFFLLKSMTGAFWQSSLVAALFALHPIHVESVAWITERKDVLSTFFFMLALFSYARYVKIASLRLYALTLLFFILGLMAKPMLVTLPFVLLLLDWWPLKRFTMQKHSAIADQHSAFEQFQTLKPKTNNYKALLLEKIPFFVLTGASCLLTFFVQQKGGAIAPADEYSAGVRIANALVSYMLYIKKLLLPIDLAVLYPHPGEFSFWKPAAAAVLLILITSLAADAVKKRPWLLMGWLWFLGTLVPVIGIIQIGAHALADRFAYIPFIGLYIILAWGILDMVSRRPFYKKIFIGLAASGLVGIMLLTRTTAGYWKNSFTLFEHALKVNPENFIAHNCLGCALNDQGRIDEALQHYAESLRIEPRYAEAHANMGVVLVKKGMLDKAIRHYTVALELDPEKLNPRNNLGAALSRVGRTDEAIKQFQAVLQVDPEYVNAHFNLGAAYAKKGLFADAVKQFSEVFRLRPEYALPAAASA